SYRHGWTVAQADFRPDQSEEGARGQAARLASSWCRRDRPYGGNALTVPVSGSLQQRTEFHHVLHALDREDFVDKLLGGGGAQNGRDQVARLVDDVLAGHGIFSGAAHRADALAQHLSVGQHYLDHGFPARHQFFELLVVNQFHFGALVQHRRVLHARELVRRFERDGLVDEHDGHQVLEAYIGDFAVVDDGGFVGRHARDHLFHLVGGEMLALDQIVERVERRLNGRADGPLLHVGASDLVAL